MKTRLKELFFGGIGGIFIGLFFSMIVSYFYNPAYLPLHPRSPIGHFFLSQHGPCLSHHALLHAYLVCHGSYFQMERKLLPKRLEHPALHRQPLWRDDSDLCTFG